MKRIRLILVLVAVGILLVIFAFGISAIQNTLNPKFNINMSKTTVIKEMKSLDRLETAQFTIEKVIDAGTNGGSDFQQLLFGDKLLLIAHGQVIAGFDMAKIQDSDVVVDGSTLHLTLPAPEILVSTLDNSQTRVYDRRTGLLNKGNKDLESAARESATQAITQAACQGQILTQASNNARQQLTTLFKTLGFTTVVIDIPSGSC